MKLPLALIVAILPAPIAQAQISCGLPQSVPSASASYIAGQSFTLGIQCASDNPKAVLHYRWSAPAPALDSASIPITLEKSASISVIVTELLSCGTENGCKMESAQSPPVELRIGSACHLTREVLDCAGIPALVNGNPTNSDSSHSNPANSMQPSAGNHVNISTGALWHSKQDFLLFSGERRTDLELRRTYTSVNAAAPGGFGPNWHHNFETQLLFQGTIVGQQDVIWIDEVGAPYHFKSQGNGTFVSPPGTQLRLAALNANAYTLTKADQTVYTFGSTRNSSVMRLLTIVERHGQSISVNYDPANGNLVEVTALAAGSLEFTYTGPRITKVTRTRDNLSYTYDYQPADTDSASDNPDPTDPGSPTEPVPTPTPTLNPWGSRLISETDFQGRVESYTYVTNAENHLPQNKLATVTDPIGRTWSFSYDPQGRVTQERDPSSGIWRFYYQPGHTSVTSPNTYTTQYYFDTDLRETRRVLPDGTPLSQTWNANSFMASSSVELRGTTLYGYDGNGNRNSVQRPLDSSPTAFTFDPTFNELTSIHPVVGAATTYTLNSTGDVIGMSRNGLALTYTRTSSGYLSSTYNGLALYAADHNVNGFVTYIHDNHNPIRITYDSRGRMASKSFNSGRNLTFAYNDDDQMISSSDSTGPSTTYSYDLVQRLIQQVESGGGVTEATQFSYDDSDRITRVTDPAGQVTTYAYDGSKIRSQPISITDPAAHTTTFTYDARDRLLTKTDPMNLTTQYQYDTMSNLVSVSDPQGQKTTYVFDANGRKTKESRPSAITTNGAVTSVNAIVEYIYGEDDQVVQEQHFSESGGPIREVVNSYDGLGRLTSQSWQKLGGAVEDTKTFTYVPQLDAIRIATANNSVANETFTYENEPPFKVISTTIAAAQSSNPLGLQQLTYVYGYGVSGNSTIIGIPSSNRGLITKAYDAAGRLITATANSFTAAMSYDSFGRKISQTNSDGNSAQISYDLLNRQTNKTWTGNTPISESLTYGASGNIDQMVREHETYTLGYDRDDRLVSSSSSGSGFHYNQSFGFDSAGDIVSNPGGDVNGTFQNGFLASDGIGDSLMADSDGLGELASEVAGNRTYSYSYYASQLPQSFHYIDSARGPSSALSVQPFYDALDRRVAQVYTGSQNFINTFNYNGLTNQMLDGVNGSGANTIYLDDDSTGEHLAESTATSNLGYETDHLGSVLNGTVANATHSYGLYGEVEATQAQSREIRRPLSAATNPVQFGYAGYEFDPASQDYHTPNRQYSPTRHTWLSQDPTGHESGDDNYYRYVHNNPLTRKDPTGLDEFQDIQKLEVIQNTLANEGTQVVSTLIRGYETLPFLPAIAVTSVIVGSSALSAGAAFLPVAPALVRAAAIANLRACAANAGVCSVVAASNATAGYAAGASGKSDMLPARFMFPINSSATGMMGGGGLVGPVSYGTGFTVGKAVKFLRND